MAVDMSAFPGGTGSPEFKAWQAANPMSVMASTTSGGSGGSSNGFSSFLTDGQIPAGSAVKSLTSQTVLPDWYTNYAMEMLSGQQALSGRPYDTYQGPRVAGFTPEQEKAFQQTQAAAGAYQYPLARATNVTSEFMGKSALPAAQPYFSGAMNYNPVAAAGQDYDVSRGLVGSSQAYNSVGAAQPYYSAAAGMNPLGVANPSFQGAESMIGRSQGYDPVAAATPYFGQAAGMDGLSAAQPYFRDATGALMSSTQGSGLDAAMPWLRGASGNVADVSSYMNPYTDAVVNRIADLGTRNLTDSIMPALEGRYITSGQFRGSGQLTDTMRAVRDTSNDILGQQSLALQQGYGQAQQAKLADLARYGQLGATAGGLMGQDMSLRANVGQTLANMGATAGNLTQGQQDLLAGLGMNLGNLTAGQQRSALDAASGLAGIGGQRGALAQGQQDLLAGIGTNLGNLTQGRQAGALDAARVAESLGTSSANLSQSQRDFLANLGISNADITGRDIDRTQAGAAQLGNLAGLAQSYGLTGAGATLGVGDRRQGLNQANLDVAYQDFLRQQGYPQSQIDAMLGTFKGVGQGIPTAGLEQGIVPSGVPAQYKPSTASQIGAGLAGLGGLASTLGELGIF